MTSHCEQAVSFAHQNRDRFLENLKELVRIPSVSTSPEHVPDMQRTAQWLTGKMESIGLEHIQIIPTAGHPVVYADWLHAGENAKTVLIYGHYDVQPAEPLELWISGAFEPEIRGENLYGRGGSDMKGQVIATLAAVESILKNGPLAVNIKYIIEGEEEIGSPNLAGFLEEYKSLLACDIALNADSGMIAPEIPTIVYGLRGLAYFELRLYGPEHDLHSGIFGGVAHNPAQVLCELIAGMHDDQGRITLPGYYDRVRPLEEEERAAFASIPMDEAFYCQSAGLRQTWGEAGYSPMERAWARPTLEVNGIISGFTGAGSKTVIPAHAMAKISMRLVPDQDPQEVRQQLTAYLEAKAPPTVRWELSMFGAAPASITDPKHPAAQAMAQALEAVWGTRAVLKREGGSVPVVGDMQKILSVDSVLTGFGLPDDNLHAPNEKLHLPTWYRGIDALIHFFFYYQ